MLRVTEFKFKLLLSIILCCFYIFIELLFFVEIPREIIFIFLLLLIGISGIIIFYYLKEDIILAIYFWAVLLGPYLFNVSGHFIKISYIIIPILYFLIFIKIFINKTVNLRIYLNSVFYTSILFSTIILISSLLNINHITPATYSFIGLWFLGYIFFVFYLCHISYCNKYKIVKLAEKTLMVFLWIGVISSIIAILEYYYPEIVRTFYNPELKEKILTRSNTEWFMDIRRTGSILGTPNSFGMFLIFCSIIAWYNWIYRKNLFFLLLIPIYFFTIFFYSNSRSALIIFFIITLIILFRYRKYLLIFFLMYLSIFSFIFVKSKIISFFLSGKKYIANPLEIGQNIAGLGERISLWIASLYTLIQKPIHFLYGYGSSNDLMVFIIGKQHAHNIIISVLQFYGIFGLVCLFFFIKFLFKMIKDLSILKGFIFPKAFYLILVAMLIHSFVGGIFIFNPHMNCILYPLIAFIIRLSLIN